MLQMIEGNPPFSAKQDAEVAKSYAEKERPRFRAPSKFYSHGLKEYVSYFFLISFSYRNIFFLFLEKALWVGKTQAESLLSNFILLFLEKNH